MSAAKPIPEWADKLVASIEQDVYLDGDDQLVCFPDDVARLVAKTRADALREALRCVKEHLGDGECHDICDCEGYFDKAIPAMIDKDPS